MIAEERRAIILKELNDNSYITATELASRLKLSAATIRRDFAVLEKQGLCFRKRGGAVRSGEGVTLELPYETKRRQKIEEKRRIAEAAAKFVQDGDTIILDAGSTTYALATLLLIKQSLTVVTNDLQIAVLLAANPRIQLICTGGIARPSVFSFYGSVVESFIKDLRVDKTFLGADAIHPDCTVANVNFDEVPIKRAMLHAAKHAFVLADSTKFEKTGLAKVCHLAEVDAIITDSGIPQDRLAEFRSSGLHVVLV